MGRNAGKVGGAMKDIKITCDECGKDLTEICDGYDKTRLHLQSSYIYNTSNISFGIPQDKGIREHHFCDLPCLKKWIRGK